MNIRIPLFDTFIFEAVRNDISSFIKSSRAKTVHELENELLKEFAINSCKVDGEGILGISINGYMICVEYSKPINKLNYILEYPVVSIYTDET
ncbi:MAG: hypothetical protein WC979_03235 [Candidatus Pacearchaeota archaeon]|jgi:hypothetical protein